MFNLIKSSFNATFASLRHRNFRYFWLGQCVSLTGTWMQRTAQVWLVYTLTESPLLVGILGVCQFIPMLLFSLFAGVYVDRFPKRKILILTQAVFMFQALTLTVLTYFRVVEYWHVLILSALFGLTQTVDMPTRQSFFIEMVGRDDVMNAISLNSTIVNLAKIVGPAISGIIMVKYGPVFCFFLNGISYIAVLGGLLMINTPDQIARPGRQNVWQAMAEGIQYIKQSDILLYNVYIMAIVCTFALNNDILIPVFAKSVLGKGATGYTSLMSALGVGSLLAALILATISKNGLKLNRLLFSGLGIAALQIITAFTRNYWISLLLTAGIGFAHLAFINTGNSIFQLNSNDQYRGRVMSVYAFLNQGSTPIGNFFAGIAMEQLGGSAGFLICGLATLLLILIPLLITKKRWSLMNPQDCKL